MCERDTEWSGILIYQIIEGSMENLSSLVMRAVGLYPMNYGSGAYTEYEATPEMFEVIERYPNIDPANKSREPGWMVGHIHSHNKMDTFFSGTDKQELATNAVNFPIYLSLIVNYDGRYKAKIAKGNTVEDTVITISRSKNGSKKKSIEKKQKNVYDDVDCTLYFEMEKWMLERTDALFAAQTTKPVIGYQYNGYNQSYSNSYQTKGAQTLQDYYKSLTKGQQTDYQVCLNRASDLISLGLEPNMALADVMREVGIAINYNDLEDYTKAFRAYFTEWWDRYYLDVDSPSEVLLHLRMIISKTNSSSWLYSQVFASLLPKMIQEYESTVESV